MNKIQKDTDMSIVCLFAKKTAIQALAISAIFFSTWGSGLRAIFNTDVSKLFVIVSFSLVLLSMFLIRNTITFLPKYFKYYLFFILFHTVITFTIAVPDQLRFGYVDESVRQSGLFEPVEASGMIIARVFLLSLFSIALFAYVKNEKQAINLGFYYGLGFTFVTALGGYTLLNGLKEMRIAGGFLDPNAFGISSVMAIYLCSAVIVYKKVSVLKKILSIIFVVIGIISLVLSGSRGALLGSVVGFLSILIQSFRSKNILTLTIVFSIILITSIELIPEQAWDMVRARSNIERIKSDHGAGRIDIWKDYIRNIYNFCFIGVGIGRSREVIKDSFTYNFSLTHNQYLEEFVDFGIVGLSLFLMLLYSLWKKSTMDNKYNFSIQIYRGLFFSWLIMMFFVNVRQLRDFWIFLGLSFSLLFKKFSEEKQTGKYV